MDAQVKTKRMTITAAKLRAREILDAHQPYERFSPEALQELSALTGTELREAFLAKNPKSPNDKRHLHVLAYTWDTPQQFSWVKAIEIAHSRDPAEARRTRTLQKQLLALRMAIQSDLAEFRACATPQECAQCQSQDDLTTDHVKPPFIIIANEFIRIHGPFALKEVQGCCDCIADEDVEAEWITFHAARAVYQLLCRSCNASKGAR